MPIPVLKQQDRLFITIGQNDTSANYNTQDYANDTVCFQEALNSSENLVIFLKNSNPVNGFTTYELETVALTTVKRLVLFSDGNVIIKQKAGTDQNVFNNYDYTQQPYTFNFLDYFETYGITYDRNSDNQIIKNFTIFNFNCDTAQFPEQYGKGPTGHGEFYFHNIELNNNGWNDFESQALGSGQSPIHIRSAEEVTIEKVKGNNNDALFALSRISKITVKDVITKNFYFDSLYIVLSKNIYIENVLASGEGTGFGIYNCQDVTVKNVLIKPILYTVQSVISNTEFTANLPSNDDNRYGGARTSFNGSYNRKMAVYWVSGNNANKLSASTDYVGSTKKITLVTSTIGNIQAGDTFYIGAREVHLDSEVGINLDSENINLENISSFYPCKVDTNGDPFNAGALLIGDDVTNCIARNITIVNPFSYGLETISSEAILENITVKNAGLSGIITRTTCYLSGIIKTTNNGFRNQSGDTDGLRIVDSPRMIIGCIISKGNVGFGIRSFGTSDYVVVNSGDLQGNTTGTYTLVGTNNKISSQVI